MKQITLVDAVKAAEAVVREKGQGYVDTNSAAYFTPDGKGSCLVGCIFAHLGITRVDIGDMHNGFSILGLVDKRIIDATPETVRFLALLQGYNDHRVRWGWALDNAMETFGIKVLDAEEVVAKATAKPKGSWFSHLVLFKPKAPEVTDKVVEPDREKMLV